MKPVKIIMESKTGVFEIELSTTEPSLILRDSDGKEVKVGGERAAEIGEKIMGLTVACAWACADCPSCGLPGRKHARPDWITCISCGKSRAV